MIRIYSILTICLSLGACVSSSRNTQRTHTWIETYEDTSAAGLNKIDLLALEAYLRFSAEFVRPDDFYHTYSGPPKSAERYSKKTNLRRVVVSNQTGLRIGIIYDSDTGSFWIADPTRFPTYDVVTLERSSRGYLFTLIEGSEHFPTEVLRSSKGFYARFPELSE